jgi:hypothetical protein
LAASPTLNKVLLPLYESDAGKKVYEETLTSVRKNFPQYVREMEGTADGAQVPFHKVQFYIIIEHICIFVPNQMCYTGSFLVAENLQCCLVLYVVEVLENCT